jgi:hypothetical protein
MKNKKRPSYLWSLIRHKFFIIVAGIRVGKIPFWRLLIHDLSKFHPTEFLPYRKKFEFGNCSADEFDRAWLHHIHHNPHHWQHWLIENDAIEMPEVFVREMIADWLAAGRAYQGNWQIQDWINKNYPRMNLHYKTKEKLEIVLEENGLCLPNFFDHNFGSIP